MAAKVLFLILGAIAVSSGQLTKVWKLSARELIDYRAYRDITLLHFRVPDQTLTAAFNFTVSEKLVSSQLFSGCDPRKVSLFLKYGSLPVINPDGAKFPNNFSISNRVPMYNAEFQSDEVPVILNVTSPIPGDWFAVAFLSYADPNNDQILQDGLSPNCAAMIESSLSVVITQEVTVILPEEETSRQVDEETQAMTFKFFCDSVPCLLMSYAPRTIPDPQDNNGKCDFQTLCEIEFIPAVDNWYFITVSAPHNGSANPIHFSLTVSFLAHNSTENLRLVNTTILNHLTTDELIYDIALLLKDFQKFWTLVPLVRQSFTAFFTYNFLSEHADDNKGFFSINVGVEELATMQFEVNYVSDIGGTLTFKMKLEESSNLKNVTESLYNVSVVACLSYQSRVIPLFPEELCFNYAGDFSGSYSQINSTSESNRIGTIHVPFPEPGLWFITLKPFCFNIANLPIDCTPDLGTLNVSLIIESNMCTADNCGRFGDCYNYMSGGFMFSTCVCNHGYIGWGCTDDSRVTSLSDLLIAALLLTLSNMFFIPAAVMAIRRKYYTEAFVYTCTMFFSTFYHACDAGEDIYSYCLMRLNVLQFCDFYSAILSLWVTLIAMSDIRGALKSIAHMSGAVGIALGTEYNRTSLWVLVVPALVGIAVMTQSWVWRCKAQRSCYPSKTYWKLYFPPGVLLVAVGLVCYSFLQTKQNYKYVHSAWHIIMALAITFLLPSRKQDRVSGVNCEECVCFPSLKCTTSSWKDNKFIKSICWWKR
ncbi:transmembrane protein 8B-like [Zootermopsis nevadensis]|uniref:transmembrane protein 8B-like n=1 Tax=Zootermopsis nevadensis TaxID=136037 RepID=UPI000B8E86C7|nr:transmembrane protein 8B-like [Zootermopsis nevadensis]